MQIQFSMPVFKTDADGKRYLPAVFGGNGKSVEYEPTERFEGSDAHLVDAHRALYSGMVTAALDPANADGHWLRDALGEKP